MRIFLRSPVEIWIKEHRTVLKYADKIAELLAPQDIQGKLTDPDNASLRRALHENLAFVVEFSRTHFISEESFLIPAIVQNLAKNDESINEKLGCFAREHAQMHKFASAITELLPVLLSDNPLSFDQSFEILKLAFGIQSIVRLHCANEEREIYPLIEKLPPRIVCEIIDKLYPSDDLPIEHLVKPITRHQ